MREQRRLRVVLAALISAIALILLGLTGTGRAQAATDYTQGVNPAGAGSVQIWFTPATPASLVDVHYLPPGTAGQQNLRMTGSGGSWQQNVSGLTANQDVYYDWYEYTYVNGQVPYGGNTTQVDQFGFPMTAHLQQTASGYDATVGITQTRAQVMAGYDASVGAAFQPLESTYRIVAPRTSALFQSGAQAGYLSAYIDQTWSYYTTHPFTLTRLGETFTGQVSGSSLIFTKNGAGPYTLNKPSSADVFACSGALATGSDVEKALGAEFCAAFNRGVALDTSAWYTPSAYYTGAVGNDYAAFFHSIGVSHRSYAFPYDDINDQSSVQILGNSNPPTSVTLGIGW